MPVKEFECRACGHKFEVLLMLNEPNPEKCEKCGASDLKRLLSTFRVAGLSSKSARKEDEFPSDGLPGGMDAMGGDPGMGGDEMDMGSDGGDGMGAISGDPEVGAGGDAGPADDETL